MTLVNFAHPLTAEQLAATAALTGSAPARVLEVPAQFDAGAPFTAQARAMVEDVGLSPAEWQTEPLLVNLPGHSAIAAVVLAELHGRCGYFPAVLRLRPVAGVTPPRFEPAEVLNLQEVREAARLLR
jgi:hypothetical protein